MPLPGLNTLQYFDTIQQSDLGLTPEQLALLDKNGFVTGEPRNTFIDGLVDLYAADLPLFVTVDSILHAMHRSFEDILSLIEAEVLLPELAILLRTLFQQPWPADLQVYLGVPLRLMAKVAVLDEAWLAARRRGDMLDTQGLDLYISAQTVRYKNLYEKRLLLPLRPTGNRPRFGVCPESVINDAGWLVGRSGFDSVPLTARQIRKAFAAFPCMRPLGTFAAPDEASEQRIASIAAWIQSTGSQSTRTVRLFDRIYELEWRALQPHDSQRAVPCAYDHARSWLNAVPLVLRDASGLEAAQTLARQAGATCPRALRAYSHALEAIVGPPAHVTVFDVAAAGGNLDELPSSPSGPVVFHLLGPSLGLDSEVLESLALCGPMPSGLDVASIVFGNRRASSAPRHEALRAYVDGLPAEAWEQNLYMGWLACLRTLSHVPPGSPALCQTEPWDRRMLNAQMTGWAELRHATRLYARESRTWGVVCDFPAAAIDPYPEFYAAVVRWAQTGQNLVRQLSEFYTGRLALPPVMGYFQRLARHGAMLENMARRQLRAEPWTEEQASFLRQTVTVRPPGLCAPLEADGWYPHLYFRANSGTLGWPTVAAVHQAEVAGKTVHLQIGSGHPVLFYTRMSIGDRDGLFVGLVGSYYEQVTPSPCSDVEWHTRLASVPAPAWRQDLGVEYRVQEAILTPHAPHVAVELFLAPDRPARQSVYHPESFQVLVAEGQVPCDEVMLAIQVAYGLAPHPGRKLAWHVNFRTVVPLHVLKQALLFRTVLSPDRGERLASRNAPCSQEALADWYRAGVRVAFLHYPVTARMSNSRGPA